jgi:hypothetical protein
MTGETMQDWQKGTRIYEKLLTRTDTPYAELARKMLDLIETLNAHPDFDHVKPYTGMMTLFLRITGSKKSIQIHWHEGHYLIGIVDSEPPYQLKTTEVEEHQIVEKIFDYLRQLEKDIQ